MAEHQSQPTNAGRREFLKTATAATVAMTTGGALLPVGMEAQAAPSPKSKAETLVTKFYNTLDLDQMKAICFPWDYERKGKQPRRNSGKGLLRTYVSNNWQITGQSIRSRFYTDDQKDLLRAIYKNMLNPDWVAKMDKQLKDDSNGDWGTALSLAIFGEPGKDKFEMVFTGRHLTMRADGNSGKHVALGGPIFHGHAASGFNEKVNHPGNVFWHQAVAANKVYKMLDGKQQKIALVKQAPDETEVGFRGAKGEFPGIPVAEMSKDQKAELEKVLLLLVDPYRKEDQQEVKACLKAQGGLEKCSLAFYQSGDLGQDKQWDNWRLEGPSFVWYFRGFPHVHIWINVASDSSVKTNSGNLGR